MSRLFPRVTVAGVGLIGGSLALAAREAGLVDEVVGYGRSAENLREALARGVVDRVASSPAAAVAGADLVVLAAPVDACVGLAAGFRPHAPAGAILTDVGSVKAPLVAGLEAAWGAGPVIGGHPIAGSEASGAAAARADLFRGRRCILTPTERTEPDAVRAVRALWEGVGAVVEEMPAERHDEILARVSHLPHLLAAALVTACGAARVEGRPVLDYAGGGFRDVTRIAAGRAELWRDILLANRGGVAAGLAELRDAIARVEALLAAGDAAGLEAFLDVAARLRRSLSEES